MSDGPPSNFEEAGTMFLGDTRMIHAWAHGDSNAVVETENGPLRSPANLMAEAEENLGDLAAAATSAVTAEAGAEGFRDEAEDFANIAQAGVGLPEYLSGAAGVAAVADGALFSVPPGGPDGFTRRSVLRRMGASWVTITDPVSGAEFDRHINVSPAFHIAMRDKVRRLDMTMSNAGLARMRALSLGTIDRPEPPVEPGTQIVGRTTLNRRQFAIGARSMMNTLEVRRIHGHDYAQFAPERQRRLVASGGAYSWYCSTVPGRPANFRKVANFPRLTHGLQMPFGNAFWWSENGERPGDIDNASYGLKPITLTGSVAFGGRRVPLTFNGAPSVVIKENQAVFNDPLPIEVKGDLPVHLFVVPSVDGFIPLGTPYFPGLDGGSYTGSEADQTLNPAFSYATWAPTFREGENLVVCPVGYGPLAVTGFTSDPAVAVAVIGDSIPSGAADFYGTAGGFGYVNRALRGRGDVVFTNLSQPGEDASQVLASFGHYVRWQALQYVDHVMDTLGVNDISRGADLATMQTRAIAIWQQAAIRGCKVWRTTLTPVTSSTDGWTTLANQTASGPFAPGGVRQQFNDWVRAGAPMINGAPTIIGAPGARVAGDDGHPLVGYIELADAVESSRNSGKWAVTTGALTTDGTHPTGAGHQNMADVLAAIPFF